MNAIILISGTIFIIFLLAKLIKKREHAEQYLFTTAGFVFLFDIFLFSQGNPLLSLGAYSFFILAWSLYSFKTDFVRAFFDEVVALISKVGISSKSNVDSAALGEIRKQLARLEKLSRSVSLSEGLPWHIIVPYLLSLLVLIAVTVL